MASELLEMIDRVIAQETAENGGFSIENDSENWKIDNDVSAEWALSKIREEKAEAQRLINVCESQILFYETEAEKAKDSLEQKTGYLKTLLLDYFGRVPHKKTKTQESYKLPSGTLKLKFPGPKYERDDTKLVRWLKDRQMTDFVEVKESPKWGELKKVTKTAGDKVVSEDGEVIEGVTAVERAPEFTVDV